MELQGIIQLIVQAIVIGGATWLITGHNKKVTDKLDTVLKNQQDTEIDLTKIEKDVETGLTLSKENKSRINKIEDETKQIMTDVGIIKSQLAS